MPTQYLSLSELADQLEPYQSMPIAISKDMQTNIRRTLLADGASIAFFWFSPVVLSALAYAWEGFLTPMGMITFPADIAAWVAQFAASSADFFLPLNVASLAALVFVLWQSRLMTEPIKEPLHWLAAAAMIPAGLSTIVAAVITVGFLTNFVVASAIWIAFIVIAISIGISVLGGALSG